MTETGRTALSIAAEHARDATLRTLMEDNAGQIDLADTEGRTPLSYAAGNGHTLTVDHLLHNKSFVDAADNQKRTPLAWAAASGHIATSQLLLTHNADPNRQDVDGKTPLIHACINGHAELVAGLLDWNDTSAVLKDYNYSSPLFYAAAYGHDAIVEILLCHHDVITDWALQGWKEDTQKEAIRSRIPPGEWNNQYFDFVWDANTGRMPQAHAMLRGHTTTAALLSLYWNSLNMESRPVPPAPAAVKIEDDD